MACTLCDSCVSSAEHQITSKLETDRLQARLAEAEARCAALDTDLEETAAVRDVLAGQVCVRVCVVGGCAPLGA